MLTRLAACDIITYILNEGFVSQKGGEVVA